ncbi:MAG TPA: hypothetical protein VGI99_02925, partial [Gemmataceae bacterium]
MMAFNLESGERLQRRFAARRNITDLMMTTKKKTTIAATTGKTITATARGEDRIDWMCRRFFVLSASFTSLTSFACRDA